MKKFIIQSIEMLPGDIVNLFGDRWSFVDFASYGKVTMERTDGRRVWFDPEDLGGSVIEVSD